MGYRLIQLPAPFSGRTWVPTTRPRTVPSTAPTSTAVIPCFSSVTVRSSRPSSCNTTPPPVISTGVIGRACVLWAPTMPAAT